MPCGPSHHRETETRGRPEVVPKHLRRRGVGGVESTDEDFETSQVKKLISLGADPHRPFLFFQKSTMNASLSQVAAVLKFKPEICGLLKDAGVAAAADDGPASPPPPFCDSSIEFDR